MEFGVVLVTMVITTVLTRPKLAGIEANLEDMVLENNVGIKLNTEMINAVRVVSRVVRRVVPLLEKPDKDQEMAKVAKALKGYNQSLSSALWPLRQCIQSDLPHCLPTRKIWWNPRFLQRPENRRYQHQRPGPRPSRLPAPNRSPMTGKLFVRLPAQPGLTFGARAGEWTGQRGKAWMRARRFSVLILPWKSVMFGSRSRGYDRKRPASGGPGPCQRPA